jgi:hypothetical protein
MSRAPTDEAVLVTRTGWRRRWVVAVAASCCASFVLTLLLAFTDSVQVAGDPEMGQVTFGTPFGWLTQDQSALDPPFPWRAEFVSPWEHPVTVDLLPLLANLILLMGALICVWLVLASWWARRISRP